ncbi:MAG: transposase [Bacteroidetes bacterium GWF2_38_335]|nr:MAG: transposase [Bacteroidetes bacterium GWF2_38_335]OFY79730.1 MAG: transposase [Bacteroidetes bacterium RIFOXYA12_FULL_38_20]HBS87564.1 transposase [Bacteroidales bacterium]
MSQSLSKLFIHIVYHIKNKNIYIRKEDKDALYSYLGSIIKDNDSIPILINGIENHVHILCVMSKNIALSKFVEEIKGNSSRWIKKLDVHYSNFAWQGGYGGFSVSPSVCEKTRKYIEDQEKWHKKMTFEEEYIMFLKEYGIEYNEKYLWTD